MTYPARSALLLLMRATRFHNLEIMDRARVEYDELAKDARVLFIPFEEARTLVLALVDTLPIPDK